MNDCHSHCVVQIYQFALTGPHVLCQELQLDCPLSGLPWDVKVFGDRLVMTVHEGTCAKANNACILQFRLQEGGTGKATFERQMSSSAFKHPNMLLVQA